MTDQLNARASNPLPRRRAVLLALLVLTAGGGFGRWARDPDRAAVRLLNSAAADDRRRAAALAAEGEAPRIVAALARRLEQNAEPDAGVREAAVHALGRRSSATNAELVHTLAVSDPDAHVRLSAWTALARLDGERFRRVAGERGGSSDLWEATALAAAWLELGDTRGVPTLLDAARDVEHPLRGFACRALFDGVAPLLETVGRWPRDSNVRAGEAWPPELVSEVAARCRLLDLRALASDSRPHVLAAAGVRRDIGRLHGTRARLVRLLGVAE